MPNEVTPPHVEGVKLVAFKEGKADREWPNPTPKSRKIPLRMWLFETLRLGYDFRIEPVLTPAGKRPPLSAKKAAEQA